jgi:hypothetical protein
VLNSEQIDGNGRGGIVAVTGGFTTADVTTAGAHRRRAELPRRRLDTVTA